MEKRFEHYVQPVTVALLAVGCFLVVRPFLAAILFAAVVCISTWPIYHWLLGKLKGRKNLAALIMTFSMALVAILPIILVAYSLADNVTAFYDKLKTDMAAGPLEPPAWLAQLPLMGKTLQAYWQQVAASREEIIALAQQLLGPTKDIILACGLFVMKAVLDMSIAAVISFFFTAMAKS